MTNAILALAEFIGAFGTAAVVVIAALMVFA
jgi:hypothetical protein